MNISDEQVRAAEDAREKFWATDSNYPEDEKDFDAFAMDRRAMRAALEAYERTRAPDPRVVELVRADREYLAARREWDQCTACDPEDTSDKTWRRVADRFEAAVMRQLSAVSAFGDIK